MDVTKIYKHLGRVARRCIFSILSVATLPNHIAFIMDGNRRYTKQHNLTDGEGHRLGFKSLMAMLMYCYELKVKCATFYAFSIENFKRSPEEVQSLMNLMEEMIYVLMKDEIIENGVMVYVVGNLELVTKPVRIAAEKIMDATAKNTKRVLLFCLHILPPMIFCILYKNLVRKNGDVVGMREKKKTMLSMFRIERHLYMTVVPELDIILRSSGETRLSNFLLLQSTNCLLYSPSVLWPEIGFRHLLQAILVCQNHSYYLNKQKQS